ncbi:MAG: Ig-like domain-containing protein [Dehalococcoidia bacterium]|nr:Ig-like domain-containing protein [Dehalococcoidia bacterium]
MTDQERFDHLDRTLDDVIAGRKPAASGDPEVDALTHFASGLRGLPDPAFKDRLHHQLFPPAPGLVYNLRRWLSGGRRPILAGALALATAAAVAVAVYFITQGGGGGGEVIVGPSTPTASVCDLPTVIEPPAAAPSEDWQSLTLSPVNDCFRLAATSSDAAGVALDSSFVLEAQEPVDSASLASRLQVEPELKFEIAAIGDSEASAQPGALAAASARYRIQPEGPLAEDTVYRFTLLNEAGGLPISTWAFQTERPLRVVQTLPADQSTHVPLNVGIELTFSHDGVTGVEENFRITPSVEGRFEIHKRVAVFVPQELQPETLYTVTLSTGVGIAGTDQTLAEEFTFQFETGSEERTGQTPGEQPTLQFTRRVWESATAEAPALSFFAGWGEPNATTPATLPFSVYHFADVDAFLASLDEFTAIPSWASVTRSRFTVDTAGLQRVASFEAALKSIGQYSDLYIIFPEALPEGYYLVETTFEDRPLQAWLQVTDVATYVSLSRSRTLLWVNDVAAKGPLANATVSVVGDDFSTTTGSDGMAFFDTPADLIGLKPSPLGYSTSRTVGNLMVTAPDGRTAVVPLADIFNGYQSYGFREYGFSGDPSLYWRFLYTDRRLYRPTDTVNFWGLVRLREEPLPSQEITVELSGSDYTSFDYRPVVIASGTVTTTPTGTFIGELPFKGVSHGYYSLRARVGDQVITSTYFKVQDFTKPAYKIDVVPSKKAILVGEEMEFAIKASFFEGSPVPNVELNYTGPVNGSVTTDANGEASVPCVGNLDDFDYRYGDHRFGYLKVVPALAEEGEITGGAGVQLFPSALTMDATAEFKAETNTVMVSGSVYNVDLERINNDEASDFSDYLGDPAVGRQVTADVTEVSYQRVEIGETYDFIAKIVRKEYRYDEVERSLGGFSATSDADGRFAFSFPAVKDKRYDVNLRVTDDAGRTAHQETYIYSGVRFYGNSLYLHLDPESQKPYAVGDQVALTMRQGDEDLPASGDNRYLFYLAQNGIRSYAIQDGPHYSFAFAEEHIPNVNAIAVRFTGATYQEVSYGYTVRFDSSLRKLNITVQPDQERYRPGDKATLSISVSDKNGRPVQAEVILSAVDEAIFRLEGEDFFYDLEILSSLYQTVSSGVLRTYSSHQYPVPTGAERGGEGGAREDFKDVALFDRVTTDADGRASIAFDLPDNLTSWRVSALAVSQDLYAGSSVSLVPVGLPFFVDVAMNSSYLTSDQPSIRVRAFGEELSAGDQVTFEVTSPTLLDEPLTASGTAFTAIDIPLPPLREGQHELTIKASAHGLEDALVRSVTVVPSRLLHSEARFYELQPGQSVAPEGSADRLTRVVITDHNRGRYYPDLLSLSWTYGDRVDQMLARNLAQELLLEYFQEEATFPAEFHPSSYQTTDGGIAIFPFADNDLVLSARAAALAPERFGRQALVQYFRKVADDANETRERTIIAMYGLAALEEPMLPNIQAFAALTDLSPRERLYLGLAAAELGDQDTARSLYRGLLEEFGQRRGGSVRLNVGVDQDDILEATSLAAILGASLADNWSPLLFDYTTTNYTHDTLIYLEQISFLVEALPNLSAAPVRFAYTLDGQRTEEELDRGNSLALHLTPEELRDLNLEALEGTLGIATSFLAPFDPSSVQPDPVVSISRSYQGQPKGSATIEEGELVRITIAYKLGPQAVSGCYQVSDLLPSGLKPITRLYQWGITDMSVAYPYAIEGQRVSFCVYRYSKQLPLVYYARVIGKGTYSAEPAVIQSQQATESINLTGSLPVEIR